MKKYIFIFVLVSLSLLCSSTVILSAEIYEYPEEIELSTNIHHINSSYIEEFVSEIIIKNVRPDDILEITFNSYKRDDFNYLKQHLKVKYSYMNSNWKEWNNLVHPLEINFNVLNNVQNVKLHIKFLVPQSIKIRRGVYSGELSLNLI